MPSFRNICVLLGCVAAAAAAMAQDDAAPGKEKREGRAMKAGSKEKPDSKEKDGDKKKKKREPMPFPLPVGHGGKGMRIPYLDGHAVKTMQFVVGTAKRTEEHLVVMSNLKIQMLAEDDAPEMTIDLPNASLDLVTRVIEGEKAVKLKRADFELAGDRLEFDTVEKKGTLKGHVRMLIYNLADELSSDAAPAAEPASKPRE